MKAMLLASSAVAASAAFVGQPHLAPQQQQRAAITALNVQMVEPIKLGTRGSPLALAQAYETKKRLAE
eukprot:4140275-Prymnesium_polylepis.1